MGKFVIKRSQRGQYYFVLKADNGEIILSGEEYTTIQNCKIGIDSVKLNSQNDFRYIKRIAVDGSYYFVLNASNGETIGSSEMYTTSTSRDKGIESVKNNAKDGVVSTDI